MTTTYLYNDNFMPAIQSADKPVMVDFSASWCGPCRMIAPIVEEIAEEYDGMLDVYKVDVDEADAVAAQYEVMSIPTIMFFKNGEEQERIVGFRSKEELLRTVQKYL
ncbi:MAG: thioredoxin [Oscillospiraceae bacterium]|nr:thioredoxin [Oscillospiraceae bacterium]